MPDNPCRFLLRLRLARDCGGSALSSLALSCACGPFWVGEAIPFYTLTRIATGVYCPGFGIGGSRAAV